MDPLQPFSSQSATQPERLLLSLAANYGTADFEASETRAEILHVVCQAFGARSAALASCQPQDPAQFRWQFAGEIAAREMPDSLERFDPLARQVLAEGRPIQWPVITGNQPASGNSSDTILCAPLIRNEKALGAILVFDPQVSQSGVAGLELLLTLAHWIAGGLTRSRQIQALRAANADLEIRRQELLHSRDTLRALFDSVPTSMYIIDPEYTLLAVNMSRAGLAGEIPRKLVSNRCYTALFQHSAPCPGCQVGETFTNGRSTRRFEQRGLPDGSAVEYEITSFPIHTEAGQAGQVILFEDDVTEKRRLEASLAQAEKLAAVGQLAAGVAHEINNPLTAVIANAQLLQRELDEVELKDMAALIQQAGERASGVVRELLDLARQEPLDLASVDVNATLRKALALAQPRLTAGGIQVQSTFQADLPVVQANADRLVGVWLNLLINAADAIQSAGGEIQVASRQADRQVLVTIHDNGPGILPEHMERIFEPFFTTKQPGHGTGLGLSISHRFIRQIGGDIRAESQPGIGTTITISLPVA